MSHNNRLRWLVFNTMSLENCLTLSCTKSCNVTTLKPGCSTRQVSCFLNSLHIRRSVKSYGTHNGELHVFAEGAAAPLLLHRYPNVSHSFCLYLVSKSQSWRYDTVYDQMRDLEKSLIQKSIPSRRVSEQCHVSIKELSIFHTSDRSEREDAHVKKTSSHQNTNKSNPLIEKCFSFCLKLQ